MTSQNVSFEAQAKNFFISEKSFVLFSKYSSFCIFNHPMMYHICDVMMSISTWDKVQFWIYHLNCNLLTNQIGQLIDINKGNNSQEFFEQLDDWG